MRKSVIAKLCLVLALLLAMQVFAVSCNTPTPDPETPTEAPTTPEETPTEPEEPVAVPVDVAFIKDGVFQFTVIVPDDADSAVRGAVDHFNVMALSLTKKAQQTLTLSEKANATTEKFIYAGFLPSELEGVYLPNELYFGTYAYGVMEDGSIYISSYTSEGLSMAVTELTKTWRTSYDKNAQALNQSVASPSTGISNALFGCVPVPENYDEEKNAITTFTSGEGITQMYMEGINTLDAVGIFEQFENSSVLTTHTSFELGDMTAGTYIAGNQYVYYVTHHNGALRVNAMSYRNAYLPENVNEPNFEKVCDTKGYMIGVSDSEGTQNGMCFVYLLADGTFLIYDGGQSTPDADHLYSFMSKLATQNDIDEIVISALHITHAHGDHTGYYESFLYKYVQNGKVTLKELWLNRSVGDLGGTGNNSGEKNIVSETQKASPKTKIVQPMTGQSFYLADMKVDIIHTMADHEKDMCFADGDANAASTMTRLTVNGFSVLMTGDAYCDCSDLVASMYGEDLHVDALQVPHHGVWRSENGTVAFYNAVNPTYALFPCGETLYKTSAKQAATTHLLNRVMKDRNTKGVYVFVAGHYVTGGAKERITEINFEDHKITVIVNVKQEG